MKNEFEVLFENINHEDFRKILLEKGASLIRERFLQKRVTLNLPDTGKHYRGHRWLRVRDDGKKITLALKSIEKNRIDGQFETEIEVSSFDDTISLLENIGCERKSFQESFREIWGYKDVEIVLDTWPLLPELVEIESHNPDSVKSVSEELGLNWEDGRFCTVSTLYSEKYGITEEYFNNEIDELRFNSINPFV